MIEMIEICENFEIEDLGIQEDWVYDIEVEDNHNFFGNNILVHNSAYYNINAFMQKIMEKQPNLSINEYVTLADDFEKKVIQPVIQQTIDDFATELNAFNPKAIGAEREIISDCLAPHTALKVQHGGNTESIHIAGLASRYGINTLNKKSDVVDISNENVRIASYNTKTNELELKRILNIQKKITTKQMLRLTLPNGKKIECTEDHKFAVMYNGTITFKEAKHLTPDDDVVFEDTTLYSLGYKYILGIKIEAIEKKRTSIVYDIEVEDNHNFFANNFLVHNCAVFSKKKKYYARVRDSEGTRYPEDSPYIKVMGFDIIKSSTPKWSKKNLKDAIPTILDKNESEMREWLRIKKQEFLKAHLLDIAQVGSVSNLDYTLGVDKGIPIGSRAAICHNDYIKNNNLENKYNLIQADDKCMRLFLITPNKFNSDIVAFTDDRFIDEIDGCVDYDKNFEKGFLKPLELMTASLKYNLEKETQTLDDW